MLYHISGWPFLAAAGCVAVGLAVSLRIPRPRDETVEPGGAGGFFIVRNFGFNTSFKGNPMN